MAPNLIATPKAEETLFSLLIQIPNHLVFLFNVWRKFRCFFHEFFKLFQITDFVARMGILCSKLEVCLPLAYPSTICKHFSSLKPLTQVIVSNLSPLVEVCGVQQYKDHQWGPQKVCYCSPSGTF